MGFGETLKSLRMAVKLTQKQLADKSGYSQATINRIEHNTSEPSVQLLIWYADYFDVSMDYLCGRTDKPEGRLYEAKPKIEIESEELKRFIEMCFEPGSPMNEKLKTTLIEMMEGQAK